MSLESTVDKIILTEEPNLSGWYYWDDGLCVQDQMVGASIVKILEDSGLFGNVRFILKDLKVEFDSIQLN